jgi:chromosome segregation ATPase
MADLANYADYCRRHAQEAIHQHNNHIEACNRVIESAETGRPLSGSQTEGEWKAELEKLRAEVADKGAAVLRLTNELAQKSATVTDLSARVDELARGQNGKSEGPSNMDLVARVSRLTDEVQSLRQENSRLKRENQNAGGGNRVR